MQTIPRMTAVLLLIALVAALPGAQAFALSGAQADHPAGCHSHRPTPRSPGPISYQCCANGHHWAISGASFSPRPLAAVMNYLDGGADVCLDSVACRNGTVFLIPSTSPPGSSPLRI